MGVFLVRTAIVFAGIIVAGALLNLYILVATFTVGALLAAMGVPREQEFMLLYWPCLIGGFASAFFVMRPAWRSVGKKPARKETADTNNANSISN